MTDLVYLLSPSFAGSTLLTFLLAAHPGIATVGELKATAMGDVDTYDCSCGRRIMDCPMWRRIAQELLAKGHTLNFEHFGTHFRRPDRPWVDAVLRAGVRGAPFEVARSIAIGLLPGARKVVDEIGCVNEAFVDAITKAQGGRVFLDGSKDPTRLKFFRDLERWNIKVIHLIRDARGNTFSFMKHYDLSAARAAGEWLRSVRECECVLATVPSASQLTVRYEDLCANADSVLATLFEFLDLDPSRAEKEFGSVEYHIIGNSMRLNFTSEIKPDEKWRDALSKSDLALIESIAGAKNRSYGYD